MEDLIIRRRGIRRFIWSRKFTIRQKQKYPSEDVNLLQGPNQSAVHVFMNEQRSSLDPPQYNCPTLQAFLDTAREECLVRPGPPSRAQDVLALVDDRRDPTGWLDVVGESHAARDWDGYSQYPPQGENVQWKLLNITDLYLKLLASVRCPCELVTGTETLFSESRLKQNVELCKSSTKRIIATELISYNTYP